MTMRKLVDMMIKPLRARVYNIVSRGVLEMAKDEKGMQVLKAAILAGENRDDIEYFQDYGFTSVPKSGSEVLVVCPQGNREHMIAVKVADRTVRLKGLAEGEVAVYTDEGDKIHFKRGGTTELVSSTKVIVTTPLAEFSQDVNIKGDLTVDGDTTIKGMITIFGNIIGQALATITGAVTAGSVSAPTGAVAAATIGTPTTDLDTFKNTYNTHTHNENGTGGGTTDAPNQTV